RVECGDVVLGLASSGLHSNGFSLVRAIVKAAGLDLGRTYPDLEEDRTLGQVLLTPTRIYVRAVLGVLSHYRVKKVVGAMAHITGGGLAANLERVLPDDLDIRIKTAAWSPPPIFAFLQRHGNVDDAEMQRVFNLGVGFVLVVRPDFARSIVGQLEKTGETVHRLGTVVRGDGHVRLD
ncbi:MAG: AIR synthase-related protein, partial [Phycisphaerae bacterium]|nr:AIR synthase-related protein [Phycisphaerae bacterium]